MAGADQVDANVMLPLAGSACRLTVTELASLKKVVKLLAAHLRPARRPGSEGTWRPAMRRPGFRCLWCETGGAFQLSATRHGQAPVPGIPDRAGRPDQATRAALWSLEPMAEGR